MGGDPPPSRESDDELSSSTEEEYGGSAELSTTDFLVYGLLSFWIYTVWRYHGLVCRHMQARLAYFRERLEAADAAGSPEALDQLVGRGFSCHSAPRNLSVGLYAASVTLLLAELVGELLILRGSISFEAFHTWVYVSVGGAALLFCAASIHFISWAARTTRAHEYHELLLARLVQDPEGFRMLQPSAKFTRRWDRNQGFVTLFLVLAVPLTLSPVLAVRQIHQASLTGVGFTGALVGWLLALFVFAALFHVLGTRLLIRMHNGHLRIEDLNRQLLARPTAWVPERTQAVLDDSPGGSESSAPGELLPRRILATIMITDMVGFSREMESSEERTYQKLLRHNEIVRQALRRNGGTEIKTMGDAFLVRFGSADGAMRAALEIQGELSAHNRERSQSELILVRIGIHSGEILTLDGDVLGNVVNVAARIEPLAEAGGICVSADTLKRARPMAGIAPASLGKRELKNIRGAPELFMIPRESIPAPTSA